LYFIEFKNGKIDDKIAHGLGRKIFDSLLILTDIIGKGISFTREDLNYILVYNKEKISSRMRIAKSVTEKSNTAFKIKVLHKFEKIYFKKVSILNIEEFEKEFVSRFSN
jgi:hypothetical protein